MIVASQTVQVATELLRLAASPGPWGRIRRAAAHAVTPTRNRSLILSHLSLRNQRHSLSNSSLSLSRRQSTVSMMMVTVKFRKMPVTVASLIRILLRLVGGMFFSVVDKGIRSDCGRVWPSLQIVD